jgi:hypothetical protein
MERRRMTEALSFFSRLEFGWRDAADIILVALIIFGLIRLIQGTEPCRCRSASSFWR